MKKTSLIIVGSGPAGLTASIYASRYQVANIVFGQRRGGTIGYAHAVENYPGYTSISGLELMEKIENQAVGLGGKVEYDPITSLEKKSGRFEAKTESGQGYQGQAVILATGTQRRQLGVPGEKELLGRGVSYCTTCDVPFFREKKVCLIGGSDAAVSGALHAADFVSQVYIIYRKGVLRAEPIWVNQVQKNPKIDVLYHTNVVAIIGEKVVTGVELGQAYRGEKKLAVDGVFIEIGGKPANDLAGRLGVNQNEAGYIIVDRGMKTSVRGVFAAGDNTDFWSNFQQMVAAEAMGAMASTSAYEYLRQV